MIEFSKELILGIIFPLIVLIVVLFRLSTDIKSFRGAKTKKRDFLIPIFTTLLILMILLLILYINIVVYLR